MNENENLVVFEKKNANSIIWKLLQSHRDDSTAHNSHIHFFPFPCESGAIVV